MIDPDRSDRLDRFYKSIFRIVGAILLVGGLWMFGYYRSAASAPTGTWVSTASRRALPGLK